MVKPAKTADPILEKPADQTWLDHLLMLLHIGAELEHSLMVEYLYAAYSLGGPQVPPEKRAQVQRWRDQLLTIAREEMGHLLCIQNLLCLLGGPINLDRDDYPWDTPYYPFRFSLEPLSLDSLSRYIYAEMEHEMDDAGFEFGDSKRAKQLKKDLPRIIKAAKKAAGVSGSPQHVDKIYNPVIEILKDPDKIPDSAFRASSYARQACWDEWGKNYRPTPNDQAAARETPVRSSYVLVFQMASRTEALNALKEVAGQGEAPHLLGRLKEEPSHFDRFVDVYQELEKVSGWSPTRHCPHNPVTSKIGDMRDKTYIECEYSRTWAELFNIRYRMLLTCIAHSFRLQRNSRPDVPDVRSGTLHRTFGEMYNIKTISQILFRLPLTDHPGDEKRAGPPFQIPYTLALPDDEADCWQLQRDLLVTAVSLATGLLEKASGDDGRYLATQLNLDQKTIEWIDTMQAHTPRRH
jgi:hypothetical protein